jgi:hypothetical protein
VKVVETPPGPPVMATLLAEIYGPDAETRRTAAEVEKLFRSVPYIVDVDNSYGQPRPRLRCCRAATGWSTTASPKRVARHDRVLLGGRGRAGAARRRALPLPIRIALPQSRALERGLRRRRWRLQRPWPGRAAWSSWASWCERARGGSHPIFRRDGRAADMVMAELAGAYEAPIYGMLAVNRDAIDAHDWAPAWQARHQLLHGQPEDESRPTCCGTANGRSPGSPSATWARPSAWRCSASTCWWSRSSAASSCRW